jgi:hypothetical protein
MPSPRLLRSGSHATGHLLGLTRPSGRVARSITAACRSVWAQPHVAIVPPPRDLAKGPRGGGRSLSHGGSSYGARSIAGSLPRFKASTWRPVRDRSVRLENGGGPTKGPKRTRIPKPGRLSRIDKARRGCGWPRDDTEEPRDDTQEDCDGTRRASSSRAAVSRRLPASPARPGHSRRRSSAVTSPSLCRYRTTKRTYPTVQAGKRRRPMPRPSGNAHPHCCTNGALGSMSPRSGAGRCPSRMGVERTSCWHAGSARRHFTHIPSKVLQIRSALSGATARASISLPGRRCIEHPRTRSEQRSLVTHTIAERSVTPVARSTACDAEGCADSAAARRVDVRGGKKCG